jgi:DNA mismatch repair protein MutS
MSAAQNHTPVMQQYLDMKREYDDAVLFFRMGDFYEMFFEDARLCSQVLGLTLTSRDKNRPDPVPMAGIPYHALNGYLTKMLRAGYKVAICEQTSAPGKSRGPLKREVVQVVTPGTVMQEEVLDARSNNFLAGLSIEDGRAGIALADVSTGTFFAGEVSSDSWLAELERHSPAEILVSENAAPEVEAAIRSRLGAMVTFREGWTFDRTYAFDQIREHFRVTGLKGFGIDEPTPGVAAAGAVLTYLVETQKNAVRHITALRRFRPEETMYLDARTRANLELTASLGGQPGSSRTLFGVIDRTRTSMGGRLLKTWITAPLLSPPDIARRHDSVAELMENRALLQGLQQVLGSIGDMERLISRVCLERATPRDMAALAGSLACSHDLKELLSACTAPILRTCAEDIADLRDTARLIAEALVDEPPLVLSEGGIFRDGYHAELDELRTITRSGRTWIAELQAEERRKTGIATLKVKYNSVFGYYIEVSNANRALVPEHYLRKQTLVNAERYITPELKEYEARVLGAAEKIAELEKSLFGELRKAVAGRVREIQAFSNAAARVDVLQSYADAALEKEYVRPDMDDSGAIQITDGRHPVVEDLLQAGRFVSNDTLLDSESDQVLIITGPNMAGKSTYLRQVGLIVLMAQAGSFVPASTARIGVVDRIFTRVGASDNLAGGESTFLVEMHETADILNNCTPRSLILFDEVGRGTSTFDGLSIAWAIVEYLHQTERACARTLFATHFHELTELAAMLPRVKNYNVAVREWNDEIVFLRKILEGGSDQSLGIQVARLAGLPSRVIGRAKEILANLEKNEFTVQHTPRLAADSAGSASGYQLSLFELPEHPVIEELRGLDVETLTPLGALNLLAELVKKARKR